MKTVAAGAHYTTVTVDTAEEVKFSFPSTSLSVEASGGDITVALTDTAQAGDDETITVPDGESRMFIHHRMNIDTYYLTGSGTAKLYASNMGDVNPFKGKGKGGDAGGGNTHYRGTTTTPLENGSTTNPIVIDGESYTAEFGDVVVYGYTEFVFDGTTWSEFGRPFDTTPTQGSTNAVTSDGVYRNTAGRKYFVDNELKGEAFNDTTTNAASGSNSHAEGHNATASGDHSHAEGNATRASGINSHAEGGYTTASGYSSHAGGVSTIANKNASTAIGRYNVADTDVAHLLIVGNGTSINERSNILEVSETDMNVNGDIKINNVAIPTPYTTMPTITADMLGQIAMYVGATDANYTQGCFYVASTDGAAEPTYSWVKIGDNTLGIEEVVLYDNAEHTQTVTGQIIGLPQSVENFDELMFEMAFVGEAGGLYYQTWYKPVSLLGIGTNKCVSLGMDRSANRNTYITMSFDTSSSVTITNLANDNPLLTKIIGRRYTRVSPTGYRQTVLWEYDPNTMQIGQNITLSDKFSNYDEIYFDPYYSTSSVLQPTTRAGGSIYLSALFAGTSDTNRQYLSVNGVAQGAPEFCDFYYDGNVTLYAGVTKSLWVGKIIGIKY